MEVPRQQLNYFRGPSSLKVFLTVHGVTTPVLPQPTELVSVYSVLQLRGGVYADVLPVLQVPDNKADAVPCKRLQNFILAS